MFSFTNIGTAPLKHFLKSSPRKTPNENSRASVFRSRSIDSMSGNEPASDTHSGGEGIYPDEKPPASATFAKTFLTLKKRFSRTTNPNKQDSLRRTSNMSDSPGKPGGDDSEGSSAGEEGTPLSFAPLPTSNPDLTGIPTPTPVALTVLRSLPSDKAPTIITSPPPNEPTQEKNVNQSKNDESNLSKTWSSGAFTGAQLRGTCSIEYAEHMKDKSHKRKAHVIDLRKDDPQQPQPQTPNPLPTPSKRSYSTTNPSYHNSNFTQLNIPGALLSFSTNLFYSISPTDVFCLRYCFFSLIPCARN